MLVTTHSSTQRLLKIVIVFANKIYVKRESNYHILIVRLAMGKIFLWCFLVICHKLYGSRNHENKDYFETFARSYLPSANISGNATAGKLFTYPLSSIRSKSFNDAVVSTTAEYEGYKKLLGKLKSGNVREHAVNILVLSNSMGCGSCVINAGESRENCPVRYKGAWPAYLQQYLNSNLSYSNPNVFVHNYCGSGLGSSYFVDSFMQWKQSPTHVLHIADLIIVETALTDANFPGETYRYGRAGDTAISQEFEVLIRLIKKLPQNPAVFGVATSPTGGHVKAHLDVARPYHIPYLDIYSSLVANAEGQGLWYISGDSCRHLSVSGQRLAGIYITYFLTLLMKGQRFEISFTSKVANNITFPIFVDPAYLEIYENGTPLFLQLSPTDRRHHIKYENYLTRVEGFSYYEDVPQKPGFIGENTSDYFSLHFNSHATARHCRYHALSIGRLVSYENMGTLEVKVNVTDPLRGSCVSTFIMDSLRPANRASITETSTFYFNHTGNSKFTIDVLFTIVASKPQRKRNKVKFFYVVLI